MHQPLKQQAIQMGKPNWRPMLSYLIELHEGGMHPPFGGLPYSWEEIAPGGEMEPFFGHWDTVHISLDTLYFQPKQSIYQILNILALQQQDGLIPGHVIIKDNKLYWSSKTTFPPLWPFAVQEYIKFTNNLEFLEICYEAIKRQISWFEKNRAAGKGFYYLDILDRFWESGVEDGVRYDGGEALLEETACIDATSHLYVLYSHAALWAQLLNQQAIYQEKAEKLSHFIQETLFDADTGYFYDQWVVNNPLQRKLAFEGLWPLIVGAATSEQAQTVINAYCLEPQRFNTHHPLPSIGVQDPYFSYDHWRGPVRNSITYWVARGCQKYGRIDAAKTLLEKALDATADQFHKTGKIWEFYHPQGGDPRELSRKKGEVLKHPCCHYLGHNPLIAMTYLWESSSSENKKTEEKMYDK